MCELSARMNSLLANSGLFNIISVMKLQGITEVLSTIIHIAEQLHASHGTYAQ